jgi:hypothetical protein
MKKTMFKIIYTHTESFDTIEKARSFRDNLVKDTKYTDIRLHVTKEDPFGDHFSINPSSVKGNEDS